MNGSTIEHTIPIGPLPTTIEEYITIRDQIAYTPEGGAAAFVLALACYAQDPTQGLPYITISITMNLLDTDPNGYKGRRPRLAILQNLRDRLHDAKAHIPRSYFQGTSPENAYTLPEGSLSVRIREQRDSTQGDRAKVFVYSTGADSPRSVSLLRNDKGIWKATEWSSLEVGVRAPVSSQSDDL